MMQKFCSRVSVLLLFFVVSISTAGNGQPSADDIAIIEKVDFEKKQYNPRHIHFMKSPAKSPLIKYNPVFLFFGSMMYFYQSALSPQISADCRFTMSCSNFSKNAITEFGLVKGVALSADRILKCNRIGVSMAKISDYDVNYKILDSPSKYRITP
jgi:uncharacterized protein